MPAPRKPTALKKVQGTDKRNKTRLNPDEPAPEGDVSEAPGYFTAAQVKVWQELRGIMFDGMLGQSDSVALEVMAVLLFRFRYGRPDGGDDGQTYPLTGAELSTMRGIMGEFGMTPSTRAKISVPKKKKANPFAAVSGGK